MSPTRRRAAVAYLVRRHKISERRACQLVGQHRSTQRYVGVPSEFEARLVKAMRQLAEQHPRWGYRRVTRSNRRGHFEDRVIHARHVEALAAHRANWDSDARLRGLSRRPLTLDSVEPRVTELVGSLAEHRS